MTASVYMLDRLSADPQESRTRKLYWVTGRPIWINS